MRYVTGSRLVAGVGLLIVGCVGGGPLPEDGEPAEGSNDVPNPHTDEPSVPAKLGAATAGIKPSAQSVRAVSLDLVNIEFYCPKLGQSGACEIVNKGVVDVPIDGYSVTSTSANLDGTAWANQTIEAGAAFDPLLIQAALGPGAIHFRKSPNVITPDLNYSVVAEVNPSGVGTWASFPARRWPLGRPMSLPGVTHGYKFQYTNSTGVYEAPIVGPIVELAASAVDPIGDVNLTGTTGHTCARWLHGTVKCWGNNDFGELGLGYADVNNDVGDAAGEMGASLPRVNLGPIAPGAPGNGAKLCPDGNGDGVVDGSEMLLWQRELGRTYSYVGGPGDFNLDGVVDGADLALLNATPGGTLCSTATRKAKAIATGSRHTCAILDNDQIKCWGHGGEGALGLNDQVSQLSPSAHSVNLGAGITGAKAISAGGNHTCAILNNDQVKCWGTNANGELGVGINIPRELAPPAAALNLGAGLTAKAIATGYSHTCALLSNDQIKCWGSNSTGEAGVGAGVPVNEPGPQVNLGAGRSAKSVVTGLRYTCALLDNNEVKCWGANGSGQLGQGDVTIRHTPSPAITFGAGLVPTALTAGTGHVCAVFSNGTVRCWGDNPHGSLGQGLVSSWPLNVSTILSRRGDNAGEMAALAAIALGTGRTATSVVASRAHVCALLDNKTVKCWGHRGGVGLMGVNDRGDAANEMGDSLAAVDLRH